MCNAIFMLCQHITSAPYSSLDLLITSQCQWLLLVRVLVSPIAYNTEYPNQHPEHSVEDHSIFMPTYTASASYLALLLAQHNTLYKQSTNILLLNWLLKLILKSCLMTALCGSSALDSARHTRSTISRRWRNNLFRYSHAIN